MYACVSVCVSFMRESKELWVGVLHGMDMIPRTCVTNPVTGRQKQEGPGVLWTASLTGELQTNGGSKEVDGLPKDDTEGCHLALHIPGHGDTHTLNARCQPRSCSSGII